jgi:4-hydroxy-tetrahydrodipicolinate reductase
MARTLGVLLFYQKKIQRGHKTIGKREEMKVNIGIFGFGKTGCVVAQEIVNDKVCHLSWVIRKSHRHEGDYASHLFGHETEQGMIYSIDSIDPTQFFREHPVDVIVDFSINSAVSCYKHAAEVGTRVVSAISHYEKNQMEQLKALGHRVAVLYSPNITLGINFLIEVSKVLQRIAPQADIEIIEEHFKEKKDVSGTALRIAEDLGLDVEKHVNSIRVGGIVGKHEVVFGLPNQTIRIIHESINRGAFGQGAIYAAKWLMNKAPGVYTMEDAVMLDVARNQRVFELA